MAQEEARLAFRVFHIVTIGAARPVGALFGSVFEAAIVQWTFLLFDRASAARAEIRRVERTSHHRAVRRGLATRAVAAAAATVGTKHSRLFLDVGQRRAHGNVRLTHDGHKILNVETAWTLDVAALLLANTIFFERNALA